MNTNMFGMYKYEWNVELIRIYSEYSNKILKYFSFNDKQNKKNFYNDLELRLCFK